MLNADPFHDYVDGRFYSPTFYPPNDPLPYDLAEEAFDLESEWAFLEGILTDLGDVPVWASYVRSPAAMFDPAVFRNPAEGGWQDPWLLDEGLRSPPLDAALYPDLKAMMIEHHWNQNVPQDLCNPAFFPGTYGGCEPYYFNMAFDSAPATLFYDLSVRLLPNTEVLAADEQLIMQVGYGLWSRDTPWGANGYLSEFAYDPIQLSHVILTTDGIRGRDTLAGAGGSPAPRARDPFDARGGREDPGAARGGGRRSLLGTQALVMDVDEP
jgi:hypothetical protein